MARSKYGAVRTQIDGITFASKKEAARYGELKLMERAGLISELALQTPYRIEVAGQLICKYVCDFAYWDKDHRLVVEDVKGMKTPVYNLKKKLMLACHGITITEV